MALGDLNNERDLLNWLKQHFPVLNIPGNVQATIALLYQGTGTPEAVVTAPVGAIYQRLDGGAATSFYVKESGTGNTGWVAK
jgi:hypothetical protein